MKPLRERANGMARVEVKMSWRTNETKIFEKAARITPKRIETDFATFDRQTWKRISAFNPHLKARWLLAFKLTTDQEWTEKPLGVRYYHFVGSTLRDGRPVPADGVWLEHTGPLEMCQSGLHASPSPWEALQYAPGATLCEVELEDGLIKEADKVVARRRKIVRRVDITNVCRKFALDQARSVEHLSNDPRVKQCNDVTERFLAGKASREELDAAWAAAGAARDAAWAARDAAGDARAAAGDERAAARAAFNKLALEALGEES